MAIKRAFEITLLHEELAREFVLLSSADKACFFNCLFNENPGWAFGFMTDMMELKKTNYLHEGGSIVMKIIGDAA